ncbi:hypothetical protein K2173_010120 [Erythroxylum novogranatense]|uniref:Transmembrane protein n=1 Tax=Erythroxylum novogranatense TaxID=1862640 RepID=A0AAV8TV25_9ROSI|nr:hypothetical protein K2173_010120 [Erythroxylum novogranatense]
MESYEANMNTSNGEDHSISASNTYPTAGDHGWQKVTYTKKQRKQRPEDSSAFVNPARVGAAVDKANVFHSLEQKAEDRHRRILEAQRAAETSLAVAANGVKVTAKHGSDDEEETDDGEGDKGIEKVGEKKPKQKKPKKPKVTVAEAAAKIDASDLAAFLAEISASYEGQQEIQLMRFADYFGRAFSAVSSAQFPWMKIFRESTIAKIADIPLSHISDTVYKTSADWVNNHSIESLSSFVIWALDSILADLAAQQAGSKGSKKSVQQSSSKSQVAIFAVLAIVLRRKPDALVNILTTLRDNAKYQGQDKLPVVVWVVAQALQGDLAVGLYSWSRNLLPIVSGKGSNPQSRDLILQLVEKILSSPKARTILVNGAVRKGERLMPPSALEILMRVTFPASSARVKATERFEAVYPTLREVSLAGSVGSKAMKQVAQQILTFTVKAAGEGIPELSKEAAGVSIWCFTQTADCYKQWGNIYQDNLEASIAILKKLSEEWKELSVKLAPFDPLRETLKNFRQKNEKALTSGSEVAHLALYKDADKYCKAVLGKVSRGHGCLTGMAVIVVALAVGAAVLYPNFEQWNWEELHVLIGSKLSS